MNIWEDTFKHDDSYLWVELIIDASYYDDLADRLIYIRNAGSILVENDKYGYIIKPIIGKYAWESKEFYDKEKRCLMPYRNVLELLLKILRRKNNAGKIEK